MKLSKQINSNKREKSKEINRQFFEKIQRNMPLHFVSDFFLDKCAGKPCHTL